MPAQTLRSGEAGDAETLLAIVESTRPDVAIVDIRMPPTFTDEGIVAAEAIRRSYPSTGVLVLSQYVEPGYALQLTADGDGARGYLVKDRVLDTRALVSAVERVAAGEVVVDPWLVEQLLERPRTRNPLDDLTAREREVLSLVAEGLTDRGIGVAGAEDRRDARAAHPAQTRDPCRRNRQQARPRRAHLPAVS